MARRTVRVKLEVDERGSQTFAETIGQYRWAANHVVEAAWPETRSRPETLDRSALHDRTYERIRDETELHTTHVQLARDRAIEAMTAVVEHRNRGIDASRPTFTATFLDFNSRAATIRDDHASLATVDGRHETPFVRPSNEDAPFHRYLRNERYEPTRSTLVPAGDEWYLHVGLKREIDAPDPGSGGDLVLGVDLGMSNVAVTSTGRFWSGDRITHWRKEYAKQCRSLQRHGSRDAHEMHSRVSRRTRARVDQYLHSVANELVEEAKKHDCSIIAVEDLHEIYRPMQRWEHIRNWAYRELVENVRYKGKSEGVRVVTVDPRNTSTRCSTCGYVDTANRAEQDQFCCQGCGYENHADYNAAKNVGLTYLRRSQTGADGGAPVGVRVNGGLITEAGYDSLEAGS